MNKQSTEPATFRIAGETVIISGSMRTVASFLLIVPALLTMTVFCTFLFPRAVIGQETAVNATVDETQGTQQVPDISPEVSVASISETENNQAVAVSREVAPFPNQLDIVQFRTGGELAGDVRELENEPRQTWLVVTESGSTLLLDSRMVRKVIYRDPAYTIAIQNMDPDSPDDHWKIHRWCLSQDGGKSRFRDQLSFHLQRIIELDVNDDRARKAAGLEYDDTSGRWVRPEQRFAIHGYVKVRGGYAPAIQNEIEALKVQREQQIADRRIAFSSWDRDARTDSSQAMIDRLFRIVDAPAVPVVFEKAKGESNFAKRKLLVDAIGNIASGAAGNALVHFAVRDPEPAIRERALVLLKQEKMYNSDATAMKATHFLRDGNNVYVNRAGFVIAELGSAAPTLNLIEALVTVHQPPKSGSSGGMPISIGTDSLGGQSFGVGTPPPKGPTNVPNGQVLDALRRITGQNLRFNEDAWRCWYTENHTIPQIDLRRDE